MEKSDNRSVQQAVMSLFSPFIDEIVERISAKVLSVTVKKEPKFYTL